MPESSTPFVFLDVGGTLLVGATELEQVVDTLLFARRRVRSIDVVRAAIGRVRAETGGVPAEEAPRLGPAGVGWTRERGARLFRQLAFGDEEAEALGAAVWNALLSQAEPPALAPGARAAIELLAGAGARLGVISNWDESLEGVLERTGVSRYLDVIVSSSRIGCTKPDRRIFQAALAEARVPAERAWLIGDDLDCDARGAVAAGMRAVLVDPSERWARDCPKDIVRCARVDQGARLLLDAEAARNGLPAG